MGNIVAIVGRPNVGKSTFFNRLIERREAIVNDESGVTRDRLYGHCFWNGKTFSGAFLQEGGFNPKLLKTNTSAVFILEAE